MIAVVAEEDADKALAAMRQTEHGKNAAVIGTVTEDANVQLVTGLGGVRVLDVLYGEGLPRIC
jgi:hydrogenase expression/formation protein HypE